jgi:hypothetical protein
MKVDFTNLHAGGLTLDAEPGATWFCMPEVPSRLLGRTTITGMSTLYTAVNSRKVAE